MSPVGKLGAAAVVISLFLPWVHTASTSVSYIAIVKVVFSLNLFRQILTRDIPWIYPYFVFASALCLFGSILSVMSFFIGPEYTSKKSITKDIHMGLFGLFAAAYMYHSVSGGNTSGWIFSGVVGAGFYLFAAGAMAILFTSLVWLEVTLSIEERKTMPTWQARDIIRRRKETGGQPPSGGGK